MATKTKKTDVKAIRKIDLSKNIKEALSKHDVEVLDGALFGFTAGSLVARFHDIDVQIKLITCKAGVNRYEELEDDGE